MINDSHVHVAAADTPDGDDIAALLAAMDRDGVTTALASTPSTMGWDNSITVRAVHQHPGRFVGLGRIDLTAPDAVDTCRTLLQQGMRGIRVTTHEIAERSWMSDGALDTVLEVVAEHHGVLDFHSGPRELTEVATIARRHPSVPVLLDHSLRPDVVEGVGGEHHRAVLALAEIATIVLKTPDSFHFSRVPAPYEDLIPFHTSLVAEFGADRMMWGSDWPVCLLGGDYSVAVSAGPIALSELTAKERDLVLGGTFERLLLGPRLEETR